MIRDDIRGRVEYINKRLAERSEDESIRMATGGGEGGDRCVSAPRNLSTSMKTGSYM